jgi:hypothetical protein
MARISLALLSLACAVGSAVAVLEIHGKPNPPNQDQQLWSFIKEKVGPCLSGLLLV